MYVSRRELLGFAASAAASVPFSRAVARRVGPIVTPEQFGALGDGRTNDTAAFAAMTAHVNRQGGGTVVLQAKTYVVGEQERNGPKGYAFWPRSIMDFEGCTRPLTIEGNGARIRCADGLRYGTFDPGTGVPTRHSLPYRQPGELACPYASMLKIENCAGGVQVSNLEFDGNVDGLKIGGPWGNGGWQIGCAGLRLRNNRGPVTISGVKSHHHAQDGGSGDGPGQPGAAESVTLDDCSFSSNGRNAWSMVGGVGWTFRRCVFEKSARLSAFPGSAPKSGIDFEAEGGKHVGQIHLVDCVAQDNAGAGCLHPGSGRTADVLWEGGRIIGTTNWSYRGGGNSGIMFRNTLFLGALVHLSRETFESCTFSDELNRSPTHQLYNPYGFIIPDASAENRFVGCTVIHSRPGGSRNGSFDKAVFENCRFYSLPGAGRLDVYGHFRGSQTRFIAERGGADFAVTPAGRGGSKSAGHADDSFSITSANGRTVVYPPG